MRTSHFTMASLKLNRFLIFNVLVLPIQCFEFSQQSIKRISPSDNYGKYETNGFWVHDIMIKKFSFKSLQMPGSGLPTFTKVLFNF